MPQDWSTIAEASKHFGVTERTVRRWLAAGILVGFKIGPRAVRIDLAASERRMTPIGQGTAPRGTDR